MINKMLSQTISDTQAVDALGQTNVRMGLSQRMAGSPHPIPAELAQVSKAKHCQRAADR